MNFLFFFDCEISWKVIAYYNIFNSYIYYCFHPDHRVREEQKKLRENALAQSDMLMEYKRAIVHHASHRRRRNAYPLEKENATESSNEGGVLSIFVSLLAEPLSKTGTKRTDADHLTIELVLHLFRNILSAEPILKGSPEASLKCAQLHNECISLFERELVLEIFMVICQEMELRENAQYNLLMMELLHHLFKSQDPTAVARCMLTAEPPVQESATATATGKQASGKSVSKTSNTLQQRQSGGATNGLLRARMLSDKRKFRTGAPARHGNFGGTLLLKRQDGKQQYVSASAMMDRGGSSSGQNHNLANSTAGPKKRKNRKSEPFVGSGRTLLSHTRAGHTQNANRGPPAMRAQKTLHRFCQIFLDKCYGPVMKSLKNEFRRDSVRLEGDTDKVVFFRIVWFFFQWFRVSGFGKTLQQSQTVVNEKGETIVVEGGSGLGQLIFTMDVFTFNLVLNASSTFMTHKNHTSLAQTVALYAEMMHMLHDMYSAEDSTEQIMALGLMDRLFYGAEPVDRLPKLLSFWTPATTTREYVCDLVEVVHVTLKLLETNKKACTDIMESQEAQQAMANAKGGKKKKIQTNDAVLQMKMAAADFDVQSYFVRKIVSNGVVFMYTKLLEQYATNASHVNHRIVSLFLRLGKTKIVDGEDEQQPMHSAGAEPLKNLLAPTTSTLEPMLYNIQLILVLNNILNDPSIRNDKAYATTLSWAAGLVHNFATAASTANPVLFVEALFKHPVPHRFCELSTNLYVNEELRMIAERELLLEAQRLEILNADPSDDEDMEEDEELEFMDTEAEATKKRSADDSDVDEDADELAKKRDAAIKKRRLQLKKLANAKDADSSDEEELEFETTKASTPSAAAPSSSAKPFDNSSDDEDFGASTTTKEKKSTSAFDESSDEEGDSSSVVAKTKPVPTKETTGSSMFDESSDEEGDLNNTAAPKIASKKAPTVSKPDFDESSDEEEENEEKELDSTEEVQQSVDESPADGENDELEEEKSGPESSTVEDALDQA